MRLSLRILEKKSVSSSEFYLDAYLLIFMIHIAEDMLILLPLDLRKHHNHIDTLYHDLLTT